MCNEYDYDDEYYRWDDRESGIQFADPGGRSALRAGNRVFPCPNCGRENMLTAEDVRLGYQCDICADADEGWGY